MLSQAIQAQFKLKTFQIWRFEDFLKYDVSFNKSLRENFETNAND